MIGIIGCGYWGMNYIRVFSELLGPDLVVACDLNEDRLNLIRHRYRPVRATRSIDEVVEDRALDAVVVSTPATSHFALSKRCLAAGKHLLVEKPLTTTTEDAAALVALARERGVTLMVGHTFLYNPGVRKVKDLLSNDFGRIYYLHARRTNLGPVRTDVNALWDLASHDVAIFNYLLGQQPRWVSAVGSRPLGNEREDVGFATLGYEGGVITHVHAGWVDANKVREVVVVGSQRRIVFDDLNNMERVRVFEKGMAPPEKHADTFGEFRLLVRDGDIVSPKIENSEPLKTLAAHFLDCVSTGRRPLSDGENGLAVVRAMVAIDRSLAMNGAPVEV